MKNHFSSSTVMDSYIIAEDMLVDFLRFIPYCSEHMSVWSPMLVTIILESCSQLDSLWKYQAKQSRFVTKQNLTIKDYFTYFGSRVSSKEVVFWGEEAQLIQPYANWVDVSAYKSEYYASLNWWDAYNDLKHNRFLNRTQATLHNAVQSLAGLFVAIVKCENCRSGMVKEGWVSAMHPNLEACLTEDSPKDYMRYCLVESKLFAYMVGWDKTQVSKIGMWMGPASHRFRNWFENYPREE